MRQKQFLEIMFTTQLSVPPLGGRCRILGAAIENGFGCQALPESQNKLKIA